MSSYPIHKAPEIKQLLYELHFLQEIKPSQLAYDYVIVLGGETETMIPRFEYLISLIKQGLRFKELVFHCGIHEQPTYDESYPMTESQTAHYLYQKYDIAHLLDKSSVRFIAIPLINGKRPSTKHGIELWIAQNQSLGKCLFISSQPYILYQEAVIATILPTNYACEVVGPAISTDIPISDMLDYLAKYLYQSWSDKVTNGHQKDTKACS